MLVLQTQSLLEQVLYSRQTIWLNDSVCLPQTDNLASVEHKLSLAIDQHTRHKSLFAQITDYNSLTDFHGPSTTNYLYLNEHLYLLSIPLYLRNWLICQIKTWYLIKFDSDTESILKKTRARITEMIPT